MSTECSSMSLATLYKSILKTLKEGKPYVTFHKLYLGDRLKFRKFVPDARREGCTWETKVVAVSDAERTKDRVSDSFEQKIRGYK